MYMQLLKSKLVIWTLITISVIAYLSSMVITKIDTNFDYRWFVFWLHISSILILLGGYVSQSFSRFHLKKLFSEAEINPILIILVVSGFVNFLLLQTYPYVSISDELRDGGLFVMRIASGALKNIFAYGSYNAHGLIIPTFTSFFYYIFGGSTLTYRFPAALLSSADVVLLYLLIRLVINRQTALWSAIILATLPLHMFFAHTQVVVAFNFFWTPIILLLLLNLLKRHSFIDYIFLGTILGFTCGFHAAVRAFACLVFLILLFLEFREMIFKRHVMQDKIYARLAKIVLLICFAIVGFGPRLFFTGPQDFFHTSRLSLGSKLPANNPIALDVLALKIKNNYIKSLMVYFYEPTSFFYSENKPLFPPFLSIFFILGIGYSFFVLKKYFLNILIFILFALPFINSAITDRVNADHRLSPLFSIGAIFVAIGISYCIDLIKNKKSKYLTGVIVLLYLSWKTAVFYIDQPANKNVPLRQYLSMHTFYFLQADKQYQASASSAQVCLFVSPTNYQYFNGNIGAGEQQQYLLPGVNIKYGLGNSIDDNEVYIIKGGCQTENNYASAINTYTISCKSDNKFTCPLNYTGDITIHYGK